MDIVARENTAITVVVLVEVLVDAEDNFNRKAVFKLHAVHRRGGHGIEIFTRGVCQGSNG